MRTAAPNLNYEYDELLSWVGGLRLRVRLIFTPYLYHIFNQPLTTIYNMQSAGGSPLFLAPFSLSLNLNPIVSHSLSGYVMVRHSHTISSVFFLISHSTIYMSRKEAVCKWESFMLLSCRCKCKIDIETWNHPYLLTMTTPEIKLID